MSDPRTLGAVMAMTPPSNARERRPAGPRAAPNATRANGGGSGRQTQHVGCASDQLKIGVTLAEAIAKSQRLALLRKNHVDEKYVARRNVRDLPEKIARLNDRLANLTADQSTATAHARDPVTINGREYAKDEAITAITATCRCTSSAASSCCVPGCGRVTSTRPWDASRFCHAPSSRLGRRGRMCRS